MADDLPPFASLTTDEDRERKAESRTPGTYNLVVNPESFQHLPEYSEDGDKTSPRRGSVSSGGREEEANAEDANVVILRRFEDASRRVAQRKESPADSPRVSSFSQLEINEPDTAQPSMQRTAQREQESKLLSYFRKHIWRQLAQVESATQTQSGVEILENAARHFPPVSANLLISGLR